MRKAHVRITDLMKKGLKPICWKPSFQVEAAVRITDLMKKGLKRTPGGVVVNHDAFM